MNSKQSKTSKIVNSVESEDMTMMRLKKMDLDLTVCKVPNIRELTLDQGFYFIGRTDEEISLVCETDRTPANTLERDDGWKAFRIDWHSFKAFLHLGGGGNRDFRCFHF